MLVFKCPNCGSTHMKKDNTIRACIACEDCFYQCIVKVSKANIQPTIQPGEQSDIQWFTDLLFRKD